MYKWKHVQYTAQGWPRTEVRWQEIEVSRKIFRLFRTGLLEITDWLGRWVVRVPQAMRDASGQVYTITREERELVMALRKLERAVGSVRTAAGQPPDDAALYPTLWEYVSQTTYPGGEPRVTSSLVIVCEASSWKGCLSDKDNERTLWKTGATLEDLLASLEMAAASEDPREWRQASSPGKKKRG